MTAKTPSIQFLVYLDLISIHISSSVFLLCFLWLHMFSVLKEHCCKFHCGYICDLEVRCVTLKLLCSPYIYFIIIHDYWIGQMP